jgi:lysophospholipase L1-like esterase
MRLKAKISPVFVVAFALSGNLFGADTPTELPDKLANTRRPTLFIIGDSTVRNRTAGQLGWGDVIGDYFDTNKVQVENHAIAGRSSRTFLTDGRWDRILAELNPGDFVLMQFGHNDGGAINDDSRARGSIRGIGNETQEIDNLLTKKHEVVHTYGWYMRKYIADAKAKGATPIVFSLVPRKTWKDGKIVRSDNYRKWAAEVARGESAAFVDLYEIIARRYEELGGEKVNELFGDDHTHTNRAGAEINAACVIAGLKGLSSCAPCGCFSVKAAMIEKFTAGDPK